MPIVFCSATFEVAVAHVIHRAQRHAAALAAVMLTTAAMPALADGPPPGLAAEWSRGVWEAGNHEHPFTGFKGEDEYADPKMKVPKMPSFTPEYAKKYRDLRAAATEGRTLLDPGTTCSPLGIPTLLGVGLLEILFSKDRVTMIWEEGSSVRRIHTDGRALDADPELTFNGHSVGHWEGRTLVIESNGFIESTYIELGLPHSDKMRVIERLTQTKPDTLENDVTIIDPVALTAPLRRVFTWTRNTQQEILEYYCTNNRNAVVDGGTGMIGFDGKPLAAPADAAPTAKP